MLSPVALWQAAILGHVTLRDRCGYLGVWRPRVPVTLALWFCGGHGVDGARCIRLTVSESTRASAMGRLCHHLGGVMDVVALRVGHHCHSAFGRHVGECR